MSANYICIIKAGWYWTHIQYQPASFCIRKPYGFSKDIVGERTGRHLVEKRFRHVLPFLAFTSRIKLRCAGTTHLIVVVKPRVELFRRIGIDLSGRTE